MAPTSAELRFFTALASAKDVVLRWKTITEVDNLGFDLWRSEARRQEPAAGG